MAIEVANEGLAESKIASDATRVIVDFELSEQVPSYK